MNHFKKLPRSWSAELNLRYEFSSREIPITDSVKEREETKERANECERPSFGRKIIWRANKYTPLSPEVEHSPTENLKKSRACTFLIKFADQPRRRTRGRRRRRGGLENSQEFNWSLCILSNLLGRKKKTATANSQSIR